MPAERAQISADRQPLVQIPAPAAGNDEPFALLASAVASPPGAQPAAVALQAYDQSAVAPAQAPTPDIQGMAGPLEAGEGGAYKYGERGIEFDVATRVNGVPAGNVPLLIADGENFSVRLADVLAAIQPMMDQPLYERLSASESASEYVTLNTLRESGIAVDFDADDRLILGSK